MSYYPPNNGLGQGYGPPPYVTQQALHGIGQGLIGDQCQTQPVLVREGCDEHVEMSHHDHHPHGHLESHHDHHEHHHGHREHEHHEFEHHEHGHGHHEHGHHEHEHGHHGGHHGHH